MAKRSAQNLDQTLEAQLYTALAQLIADVKSSKDATSFIESFFTSGERSIFAKRLAIAMLLRQGKKYDDIHKTLKVSTATISSTAEMMQAKGFRMALQKMKVDAWAENWSNTLIRMFGGKTAVKK